MKKWRKKSLNLSTTLSDRHVKNHHFLMRCSEREIHEKRLIFVSRSSFACRFLWIMSPDVFFYKFDSFWMKLKHNFVGIEMLLRFSRHRSLCFLSNFYKYLKISDSKNINDLTDTGEDSKLVHRRKRSKVDASIFFFFSETSERRVWLSAESKILASTFGRFRLYRLIWNNEERCVSFVF